mmetsp:Transcript_27127/g.86333  ORF Transcript_27127/g.86333 Transcript_27127/m.86333 type:complete len:277 (+) Transcript_27127:110-940(+)
MWCTRSHFHSRVVAPSPKPQVCVSRMVPDILTTHGSGMSAGMALALVVLQSSLGGRGHNIVRTSPPVPLLSLPSQCIPVLGAAAWLHPAATSAAPALLPHPRRFHGGCFSSSGGAWRAEASARHRSRLRRSRLRLAQSSFEPTCARGAPPSLPTQARHRRSKPSFDPPRGARTGSSTCTYAAGLSSGAASGGGGGGGGGCDKATSCGGRPTSRPMIRLGVIPASPAPSGTTVIDGAHAQRRALLQDGPPAHLDDASQLRGPVPCGIDPIQCSSAQV